MYPNSLHVAGSQLHSTVPASQLHGMAGNTTAPWWELFLLQTRRICTPSDSANHQHPTGVLCTTLWLLGDKAKHTVGDTIGRFMWHLQSHYQQIRF